MSTTPLSPRAGSASAAVLAAPAVASTFEQRWDAWQAKGAAHDRAVRRRLAIAAPILAIIAAVLFYVLGTR